ncbi:hypothetical protein, partial [Nostoc sp. LEGE 12450]|uniref:hypothetical protein n=1 Tax=Nostoc sp. LEGE 12450 TaxID=1828643 RepID=UPI001D1483C5
MGNGAFLHSLISKYGWDKLFPLPCPFHENLITTGFENVHLFSSFSNPLVINTTFGKALK